MSDQFLKIESISQLHELLGCGKPKHPLITVLDPQQLQVSSQMRNVRVVSSFFAVWLKTTDCGIEYGRNHYDFEEGALVFTAPQQVVSVSGEVAEDEAGWMLFFHPDLIRSTGLGEKIDQYTFFSYEIHEALHLSDAEKATITQCIQNIKEEYEQRIDDHSQSVIVSNVELLLNYCSRYYARQFNTRTTANKDLLTRFERVLKDHFDSGQLIKKGIPTVQDLAGEVHLSADYLSDLLKKETGRSAKDHINDFVVEKAKYLLLNSQDTISGIAYELGFNYPHYFSRLFKAKTGQTPQEFRSLN
ncbi:helix-turn-helix transcriptional regulator [Phaeodactylibacter sp.]|jgi:AraC-like DNA-binding protein|uniref:helix-turn-helix domain-containing protein n=1 Tax=Phaeodactylibacter sp. TaxID=1940289 RepID=UPI0025E13C3C|nr:helix-turn-helix transcriptional regulator [Phaeodactylibacter sp.]MCI4651732.1 helix-turn-helix transcriptional regulator [Phaeodactylibacter sp.]MCI5093452.1 helix-turn-helix transcriptional regulator [Phaeodactylibacter sp.]